MSGSTLPFRLRWRRRWRATAWTLVLLAMLLGLWALNRPVPSDGTMLYASDGDSLVMAVAGEPRAVRLMGIDAPERGQSCLDARHRSWDCGAAATAALRQLAGRGAALRCAVSGKDRFNRTLSHCQLADKRDVAGLLVKGGWAIATTEEYLVEEAAARAARLGIWAGEFQSPAEWRAAHPRK